MNVIRLIYIGGGVVFHPDGLEGKGNEIALHVVPLIQHFFLKDHDVHPGAVHCRFLLIVELALGDLHQCGPVTKGEEIPFPDDLHIVVASQGGQMFPFDDVEIGVCRCGNVEEGMPVEVGSQRSQHQLLDRHRDGSESLDGVI